MKKILLLGLTALSLAAPAAHAEYCREYTKTVTVGGKTQEGFGTACLQPDGTWAIQSEDLAFEPQVIYSEPQVNNTVYVVKQEPVYTTRTSFFFSTGYYPHHYYQPASWHHHRDGRGRDHDRDGGRGGNDHHRGH